MNLGRQSVVIAHLVPTGQRDDYGRAIFTTAYIKRRRVMFAPTRTQTDETRGVPSINGATYIDHADAADLIEQADHVIYPATAQPDGTYTGPKWELVGDVGRWPDSTEVFMRRRT